jgi:hypothetical protein
LAYVEDDDADDSLVSGGESVGGFLACLVQIVGLVKLP